MEPTLYERIQFLENDIVNEKSSMEKWLEYAEGQRDIYAEFAFILGKAEREIAEIKEIVSANPPDLSDALNGYYDDYYYNFDSAEHLALNYENLRRIVLEEYQREIESHSPESARKSYESCRERYIQLTDGMNRIQGKLPAKTKRDLRRQKRKEIREEKRPKGASEVFAQIGSWLSFGLSNGINGGLDNVAEIEKMIA